MTQKKLKKKERIEIMQGITVTLFVLAFLIFGFGAIWSAQISTAPKCFLSMAFTGAMALFMSL